MQCVVCWPVRSCECVCVIVCEIFYRLVSHLTISLLCSFGCFFLPLCAFMLNSIGAQCIPSSLLADALRVLCACIGVKNATLIRCINKQKHRPCQGMNVQTQPHQTGINVIEFFYSDAQDSHFFLLLLFLVRKQRLATTSLLPCFFFISLLYNKV